MTNLEITNAYVGDTQVEKIYLGTDVVWLPYYAEEDNGTIHILHPDPGDNNQLYTIFDMDHDGTFTLYHKGTVVTANTCYWTVYGKCNEETWYEEKSIKTDFVVENICGSCQYPTSTGKKNVYVGVAQDHSIIEIYYNYCSGSSSSHTASVLLDNSVDIDLTETAPNVYEMAFTEPYTSLTLYYDNEVVTASSLSVSVDGTRVADETDFEVANISTDVYGGSSINTITFNASSNEVYIDFNN